MRRNRIIDHYPAENGGWTGDVLALGAVIFCIIAWSVFFWALS